MCYNQKNKKQTQENKKKKVPHQILYYTLYILENKINQELRNWFSLYIPIQCLEVTGIFSLLLKVT